MYSYIDMHCDSLLRVLKQGETSLYDGEGMQSIKKMAEAGQMCQFFAVFLRPEWEEVEAEKCFETLRNALYSQVSGHDDKIAMAHNYGEIQANNMQGKASAILTLEDGRLVNGRLEKLCELYKAGIRSITLTWNHANCFGYPNSCNPEVMRRGLTEFGKEAIREMNDLGILIDVSHLSDGGFWEVAEISRKPFIASHSNCRALMLHPRNLSDEMICKLSECGGVAGLNLYPAFVAKGFSKQGIANDLEYLVAHIMHFVKIGGEECVGIGSDFDGMEESSEIDCPTKMELLFDGLLRKGMKQSQLDKVAKGNVLRVIRDSM